MLRNSNPEMRAQLGLPVVPIALAIGKILFPVAVGAGLYFGLTEAEEKLGFEASRIAPAAILGGIGTAAFMASPLLPTDSKSIATIAGTLAMTGAVAILFWPKSEPELPPLPGSTIPPGQQLPPRRGEVYEVIRTLMPMQQPNTGGAKRWGNSEQEFEFRITNTSNTSRSFFAGALITDPDDNSVIYKTPPTSDPAYGRKLITIGGGETRDFRVAIPKNAVPTFWEGWYRDVDVEIEYYSTLDSGQSIARTDAIPMEFTWANPWG